VLAKRGNWKRKEETLSYFFGGRGTKIMIKHERGGKKEKARRDVGKERRLVHLSKRGGEREKTFLQLGEIRGEKKPKLILSMGKFLLPSPNPRKRNGGT